MGKHDKHLVKYAEGKAKNLGKAWNKVRPWVEFYTDLSTPTETGETRAQFDALTKKEQDALKMVSGWISPAQCKDNKRNLANILPRNLIALDVDYCEVETVEAIKTETWPLARYESVIHSTRRHTEQKPRLRVFFPLSREVDAKECHALVRIVSFIFDGKRDPIIQVDKVSARPAQIMFRPTLSKDGHWFYHHQEGDLLDPDFLFDLWRKKYGDPLDISKLPLYDQEGALRERAAKSENPLAKRGLIGAFCRAYRIEDAMEKFIPDAYALAEGNNRYMAAGGTSTPGAVVYNDGLFMYSFHVHDPSSNKNVNAWDIVRLNLFGHLDEEIETEETDITKLPSHKAMIALAKEDEGVKHELNAEQRELLSQFEDESDEETAHAGDEEPDEPETDDLIGEDSPPKKKTENDSKTRDWLDDLERDRMGRFVSSSTNVAKIILNDPRLGPNIAYNEFLARISLIGDITMGIRGFAPILCKNTVAGVRWNDDFNDAIRLVLEDATKDQGGVGWGLRVTDRDLNTGKKAAPR